MCGRFTQYRTVDEYSKALQLGLLEGDWSNEPLARYNVAPQSRVLLLHQDDQGTQATLTRWGYAPHWADGKRPPAINARIETAATSRFWGAIWKKGRVIIPADGWYEWKKDPDNPKVKQPYFIRLKGGAPAFFAGIADVPQDGEERAGGFAIITAASDEGMVDIHDRRPVVLPPDVAREWLEPGLLPERAADLARHHDTPVEAFEWYPVDKAVGNVKNQGPYLIEQIRDPLL
nr:SOS response-associated peptidase family protein [Pseudomonas sp.]